LKLIIGLVLIVFLLTQIFYSFYKPISTQTAIYRTVNDGFNITGVVIRNENYITSSQDGVLHFMIEDGERVSKNGIIANIYKSENASITLSQIDSISKKIEDIEEIVSFNNIEAANLDVANTNVSDSLDDLILSSSFGDFNNIEEKCDELLSSLNRRQAILGEKADFSEQLAILNSEYKALKDSLSNPEGKIRSNRSGYFLTKVDGYENAFDIENLSEITPDFLDNLSKKEVPENTVGKLVSDYEWYIAANVSIGQSLNYKVGDSLSLHTDLKTAQILSVKVKKINVSKDGANAVIIFSCNDMNAELASLRSASMTVVNKEYSGLYIPKKAQRVIDSKRGVYVLSGMQIKFKPIEIVYTGDNYIICKKSDEDGALRLYDQVVVKGKNLYDGKIIS
jgi:putative membrane fusion protein